MNYDKLSYLVLMTVKFDILRHVNFGKPKLKTVKSKIREVLNIKYHQLSYASTIHAQHFKVCSFIRCLTKFV